MIEHYDVVVIGSWQAGLAIIYPNKSEIIYSGTGAGYRLCLEEPEGFFYACDAKLVLNMPDFQYEEDKPEDELDGLLTREKVVTNLEDFAATDNPSLRLGVQVDSIEQVQGG